MPKPIESHVTLSAMIEPPDRERCDEATRGSHQHVFVGIPFIALCAEESRAESAAEDDGRCPFEQFIQQRCRHYDIEWQKIAPEASHLGMQHQKFSKRQRET